MVSSGALCEPTLCLGFGFVFLSCLGSSHVKLPSSWLPARMGHGPKIQQSRSYHVRGLLSLARYSCTVQACGPKALCLAWKQAGSLLPSMTLLTKKALCDPSRSRAGKWCRPAALQAICPASAGGEELLAGRSKLCLAILPFGQSCCPFSGLHININCLRQLPNASFIVLQSRHSFPWHGQHHLFCMNGADPASGTSPP